jgi:hypothetical protein
MSMAKSFVCEILGLAGAPILPRLDLGRQVDVVHQRHRAAESTSAEKLFGIEPAIGLAELDVSLLG